ncbi:hypothetical protein [Streptomyces sp. NPDC005017]|uniref:hypothetical protein n=1 Tax=Streptomyces sp. NPDC005017 TaxID=3364706 RepID=UPI0036B84DBF
MLPPLAGAAQGARPDVATREQIVALRDGLGVRVMLADPHVDLPTVQSTIWSAIAPSLGISPAFPEA